MNPEPATDWEARAREAERRADEAWSAYHLLAAEVQSNRQDSVKLERIEHSWAWRLLAPVRAAQALIGALRGFLPQRAGSLRR